MIQRCRRWLFFLGLAIGLVTLGFSQPTNAQQKVSDIDFDNMAIASQYLKAKLFNHGATGREEITAADRRMLEYFINLNLNGSFSSAQDVNSTDGGVGASQAVKERESYEKDASEYKIICHYFSDLNLISPGISQPFILAGSDANKKAADLCTKSNRKKIPVSTMADNLIAMCDQANPKYSRDGCLSILEDSNRSLFGGASRTHPQLLQSMHTNSIAAGFGMDWTNIDDQTTKKMITDYINQESSFKTALEKSKEGIPLVEEQSDVSTYCYTAGGMSWLLCRLGELVADASTASFKLMEQFLRNDESVFSQPAIQASWGVFQVVANTLLIAIALIMTFSNITGQGMSNYNIKKNLPRWLAAMILINSSMYFAKIIVDVSNILGESIFSLLAGWSEWVREGDSFNMSRDLRLTYGWDDPLLLLVFVLLLIVVGVLWIIAFVVTMILLIARNALTLILLPLAPIAFALYVLPNTKKYFSMWANSFIASLMIYPTLALFSGGGLLTYYILRSEKLSAISLFNILIPWSALIVPMLIAPFIIFKSLGKVAVAGGFIAMASSRLGKFGKKTYEKSGFAQARKLKREKIAESVKSGDYGNKPSHWVAHPVLAASGRLQTMMTPHSRGVAKQVASSRQATIKNHEKLTNNVTTHDMQAILKGISSGDTNKLSDNQRLILTGLRQNTSGKKELSLAVLTGLGAAANRENRQLTADDDARIDSLLATARRQGASVPELNIVVNNMITNLNNTHNISTIAALKTNIEFNNGDVSLGRPAPTDTTEVQRYETIYRKHMQRDFLTSPTVQDLNKPNAINLRLNFSAIDPMTNPVGHQAIKDLYDTDPNLKTFIDQYKGSLDIQTQEIIKSWQTK